MGPVLPGFGNTAFLVCIYDLDDIIIESCLALLFEVASLESQRLPSSFLMKFSGASLQPENKSLRNPKTMKNRPESASSLNPE